MRTGTFCKGFLAFLLMTAFSLSTFSQITGLTTTCVTDPGTWSVPNLPGATYTWNTFGNGILGSPSNQNSVGIVWTTLGTNSLSVTEVQADGTTSIFTATVEVVAFPSPHITSVSNANCQDSLTFSAGCTKVCETSTLIYTTPEHTGNTYTWSATGATSVTPQPGAGNVVEVVWGSLGFGTLTLIETVAGGACSNSDNQCVEIIEGPIASFSTMPVASGGTISVCLGQEIGFTSTSIDASVFSWNFGDGSSGDLATQAHTFSTPGTYTVELTVANDCGCLSTASIDVVVDPGEGPEIWCVGAVCAGDTAYYGTPSGCPGATYDWNVSTDGTLIWTSALGDSICVAWDAATDGCGTVSLEVSGCGATCTAPTIANVPILIDNAPIHGPDIICYGDGISIYSVKKVPGTTYTWDLPDGGYILEGSGTDQIVVTFGGLAPGTYAVNLTYDNAPLGCAGSTSLSVEIVPKVELSGPDQFCNNLPSGGPITALNTQTFTPVNCNWFVIQPDGVQVPTGITNTADFTGYTWAGGPGAYLLIAQPVTPSLYCNVEAAISVQVLDSPPSPDPIEGETEICVGEVYHYSIVPNGPYQYEWTVSGGLLTGGVMSAFGNSVNVTWGAGGGTLSVVAQASSGPACVSDPTTLTIQSLTPLSPITFSTSGITTCPDNSSIVSITSPVHYTGEINWTLSPSWLGKCIGPQYQSPASLHPMGQSIRLWYLDRRIHCLWSKCYGKSSHYHFTSTSGKYDLSF